MMSTSSSGVMSTFTFLSLLIIFLPSVAPQGWGDPWIKLSADCEKENKCELTVSENSGTLIIPESSAFDENLETLLAELNFAPGDDLFVECNQQCGNNDDDLILNVTLDANGGKTQVKMMGKLDYDNPPSTNLRNRQKFFFMLGVEKPSDCSSNAGACRFIFVELKDIVDERPDFIDESSLTIDDLPENVNQTGIVTIKGEDNEFQKAELELTLTDDFSVFNLTKTENAVNSWDLNVVNLDYDLGRKSYSLELNLTRTPANYGIPTWRVTTLFANVIDAPDQEPLWDKQCGYVEVPEEVPAGEQTFFEIRALDQDTGLEPKSRIVYNLVQNDTYNWQYFDLVETADGGVNVTNKEQIDREQIQNATQGMLTIVVQAREDDSANMTSETLCRVRIRDIDDHRPNFRDDFNTEDETAFHAWVKEDSPMGSPFDFCQKEPPAGEECPQEDLVIPVAYDADQYDLYFNDFTLEITDTTVNTGENFGITPSRVISSLNFFVSSQTLNNTFLDFESREEVEFNIRAASRIHKENTTTIPVKIHIIDVNDCSPEFTKDIYSVTIDETIVDQALPVQIDTTDKDKTEIFGRAGHFFEIVPDSPLAQKLTIDDRTGVISVGANRPFDFEESERHTITVRVSDCRDCVGTVVPNSAQVKLEITVNNMNDERPVITNSEECLKDVSNQFLQGAPVVNFKGEDPDNPDSFAMSITKSSNDTIRDYFNLSEDGSLTLVQSLDEENREIEDPSFTFTVMIKDDNQNPVGPEALNTTYQCKFNIIDINDETPEFTFPDPNNQTSRTWIDQDSPLEEDLINRANGEPVMVEASDSDVNADNSRVTYVPDFQQGYEEYFKLDPILGTIKLMKNLSGFPFESDAELENMISLRILAEDNGSPKRRSNPATLRLKSFKDVEPQFEIQENRIELIETDMSEKFHLISFEFPAAFDPNNRDPPATPEGGWTDQSIFYQINSSSSNLFVIEDPLINRVRVTENLDYDCATCSPAFTFTISASNKKDEPNFDKPFSVQQVTVAVMDINDNIPEFIGLPNYFVLESATQCADCRIEAFDKDTSIDKMLSFEITNITVSDPSLKGTGFNIKNFTETAPIATLEPDFTCCAAGMTGNYDVEVQVTDNVGHTSSTHVKVVVMTEQNNVTFGFDNAVDDICRHRESIMNIFLKVLGWSFTEKDPLNCVPGREASPRASSITEFDGYFVDPDTFKPKSQREIAAMYDQKFEELWLELKHQLNISLDGRQGFRGETTEQDPLVGTNFALIVIGGICAALIVATAVFLLVAYCVRTKALERRVKVRFLSRCF